MDGQTYERSAIERWFRDGHRTSPATGGTLSSLTLIPNIAIKRTCESARIASSPSSAPLATITPFKSVKVQVGGRTFKGQNGKSYLQLQAHVPSQPINEGADYIFAVDTSGSIGEPAWVKVDKGSMGITRLNLVKQVIRVMGKMATLKDRFAVVSFSQAASLRFPLTPMDPSGYARLNSSLDGLFPDGLTHIYGAVEEAAKIASSDTCRGRRIVGILLTDGVPTEDIAPVIGGRSTMPLISERIRVANPWTFHTIGFSSDINSRLLEQLAAWGQGRMLFVPSGDMVSTNAINLMAYEKTVASLGTIINYTVNGVRGSIETGPLAAGQRRDFIIPMRPDGILGPVEAVGAEVLGELNNVELSDTRNDCVQSLTEIIDHFMVNYSPYSDMTTLMGQLNTILMEFYSRHASSADPCVMAILRDVVSKVDGEGQCRLALQHMKPTEWGSHYLRAYRDHMRAGICMNFKDPGLKIFETPEFLAHQAAGDAAFVSIPPPPVIQKGDMDYSAPITARAVSNAFNNSSGSCFQGDTLVRMADNSVKAIRDIVRGDVVWTPTGPTQVVYKVTFHTSQPSQPLVQFSPTTGVTPWHPCRTSGPDGAVGPWTFPASLQQFDARPLKTVYNLVLTEGHIIESGTHQFVTLGHGFQESPLKHDFFGTDAVIKALHSQPGSVEGLPIYNNCVAIKDPESGLIVGWEDHRDVESNVNGSCKIV
jgi:Mg-chelatase subunit ChlD